MVVMSIRACSHMLGTCLLQGGRKLFVAVDLVEALQQKLGGAPLQQLGSLTGVCWSQTKAPPPTPCSVNSI